MGTASLQELINDKIQNELKVLHSKEELTRAITTELNADNTAGSTTTKLPLTAPHKGEFLMAYYPPQEAAIKAEAKPEKHVIKFVIGGAILYRGVELTAMDWIRIEKGEEFEFHVGKYGATVLVCLSEDMPEAPETEG